ncbi:MAG: glycoside hydrolase family 25 protein [Lachnospiraceae bacterium]|nr:glycoside hydrolase family 25 protein [Lachnospiraceae bacterium]
MDSKHKGMVIGFCALMVILIVSTVFVLDASSKRSKRKRRAESISQQASAEPAAYNETGLDHDLVEKYHLNPARDPYAFLQDESFFEPERGAETEAANSLSLLLSTVMKDLRIFVVDGTGSVVSGRDFEVTVQKVTANGDADGEVRSLKDEDGDGILYTEELRPGDYEVSLAPVEGCSVPEDPMQVSIAEQISYTVLKDISFLIRTEDEVDADVEDTAAREAQVDADGTETNERLQDGVSIFGIDVSKWNKDIDWKKVKASGVDFAIIRCGYRGSSGGYLIEDPYFEKNIKEATEAGVKVGVYFFTQAKTAAEGVEEASMVLALTRDYDTAFPFYIDTEGAGGNGRADRIGKTERTEAVKAFCETIENAGYTAGIYASKSWFEHNLDMEQLSGYSIWLAQYARKATYEGEYDMWQYTSAGTVDGIGTLVDFDLSYVDFGQ